MPTPSAVFTGRKEELAALHTALQTGNAALTPVPQALQGMGGVGKTQTAAYYAHSHRYDYDCVLWVIGTSPEEFDSQLANLAPELVPPVTVLAEQEATLRAVHQWFATHGDWLLIVDDAEGLSKLKSHLPRHPNGRILLTTRAQMPADFGKAIVIEHLNDEMSALLLLRRAGKLTGKQELNEADPTMQTEAKELNDLLGGLPLALDQAGAYMQERDLSPVQYTKLYEADRKNRKTLLLKYDNPDHVSVAVTFRLALQQVKRIHKYGKAAAQLVQLCAFLAPDSIPDEIFTAGASVLSEPLSRLIGNPLEWLEVCTAACKYALLRQESNPSSLWMHRLVQEVVRNSLSEAEQMKRKEQIILAVNEAFPVVDFSTWSQCEPLLPHALLTAQYITDHEFPRQEASRLFNNAAWYLRDHARYSEAEPLFKLALAIRRRVHGDVHEQVAIVLSNLGVLLGDMGRNEEAASLLEEAIQIARATIGDNNLHYAGYLENLGQVYYRQLNHQEAARLKEEALSIAKQHLGEEHQQIAVHLNNLANVYVDMGDYVKAELYLEKAQKINLQHYGDAHPTYATNLVNLARMHILQGRPAKAGPLLLQALPLHEQIFGPEHPDTANCNYWLGRFHETQGHREKAADCFRRALAVCRRERDAVFRALLSERKFRS